MERLEVGMEGGDNEIADGGGELSISQPLEGAPRGRSDTGWDADGSDAARDIRRGVSFTIEAVDIRRKEPRRVDGSIQNLDRDLPAMRMSRKQQIITLPGRRGKHVGIVLEENIGCARDDEALGAAQI